MGGVLPVSLKSLYIQSGVVGETIFLENNFRGIVIGAPEVTRPDPLEIEGRGYEKGSK